jgi:hypothetical protein
MSDELNIINKAISESNTYLSGETSGSSLFASILNQLNYIKDVLNNKKSVEKLENINLGLIAIREFDNHDKEYSNLLKQSSQIAIEILQRHRFNNIIFSKSKVDINVSEEFELLSREEALKLFPQLNQTVFYTLENLEQEILICLKEELNHSGLNLVNLKSEILDKQFSSKNINFRNSTLIEINSKEWVVLEFEMFTGAENTITLMFVTGDTDTLITGTINCPSNLWSNNENEIYGILQSLRVQTI